MDIETMEVGPELDRLIAERVMGFTVWDEEEECSGFTPGAHWMPGGEYYAINVPYAGPADPPEVADSAEPLLPYSEDIAAAWQVLEEMRARGFRVAISENSTGYGVAFSRQPVQGSAKADTAPLAICRAALAAQEAQDDR